MYMEKESLAQLGYATTEDLFRELICRLSIRQPGDVTTYACHQRALVLAEMLGSLGAPEREYRTVDS